MILIEPGLAQRLVAEAEIAAHSLGNQLLVDTLADIGQSTDPKTFRIGQVIFAVPDVNRVLFEDRCALFAKSFDGGTLYAASNDRAL